MGMGSKLEKQNLKRMLLSLLFPFSFWNDPPVATPVIRRNWDLLSPVRKSFPSEMLTY